MGKMVDALINTLGILALGFICACLIVGGSQCLAWAFGMPFDATKALAICVGIVSAIILPLWLALFIIEDILR